MVELKKHYEITKKKANLFMKMGNINAYFNALVEMNRYKKEILVLAKAS